VSKQCKSRACNKIAQKNSIYCSPECRKIELKTSWHDKYVKEFGELLTAPRYCKCGKQLAQRENEGVRCFISRESCSKSCAAKKPIKTIDEKIAESVLRLSRENSKSNINQPSTLGSYWDRWGSQARLIHNALMGARLC